MKLLVIQWRILFDLSWLRRNSSLSQPDLSRSWYKMVGTPPSTQENGMWLPWKHTTLLLLMLQSLHSLFCYFLLTLSLSLSLSLSLNSHFIWEISNAVIVLKCLISDEGYGETGWHVSCVSSERRWLQMCIVSIWVQELLAITTNNLSCLHCPLLAHVHVKRVSSDRTFKLVIEKWRSEVFSLYNVCRNRYALRGLAKASITYLCPL